MEPLIDLRRAASVLRISRSQLYRWIESGHVPAYQVAGRGKYLFRESELERALLLKRPTRNGGQK